MSVGCDEKRKKKRDEEVKKMLIDRLSRIEGQVKALKRMVEEDAYCTDILMQSSAAASAIHSFSKALLDDHVRTCVVAKIKANKEDEVVEELLDAFQKMLK